MKFAPGLWVVGILGIVSMGVLFAFDPAQHGFYPACYWKRWTGLNCAGCGGLRATHHMLHGRVGLAFRHNPLLVAAIPAGLGWLAWKIVRRRSAHTGVERGVEVASAKSPAGFAWVVWAAMALCVYTILRNIPIPALSWLSPP